jgi:hypothetical protein
MSPKHLVRTVLQADDAVRFSRNRRTGQLIAGLKSRVGP